VSQRSALKVYTPGPAEGFQWVLPVTNGDSLKFRFDGTPRASSWMPVRVARLKVWEDGTALEPSDFPAGCGFVVSRPARELLGSSVEEAGELLPLDCADGEFWTLNVTRLVDALNEESSKISRSKETGRILMIHRHSFRGEHLGPDIFKLTSDPRGLVYVTETFVNQVKATSLKGLNFKLVWAAN
jgi:hypothetical protein